MPPDVLAIADRLWNGEISTSTFHPVDHIGGLAEITDGVASSPPSPTSPPSPPTTGWSWSTRARASWPAPSTTTSAAWTAGPPQHRHLLPRPHRPRLRGAGLGRGGRGRRLGRPEVIAHHALPARFDRYIFTAGLQHRSSTAASSASPTSNWPTEYRYPDRTYHDTLDLSVGGARFALHHEGRDRRPHL